MRRRYCRLFVVMLGARLLLGVGEAMHWPMQSKFVKNWFPPGERGKANSLWLFWPFSGAGACNAFFYLGHQKPWMAAELFYIGINRTCTLAINLEILRVIFPRK